MFNNETKKNYQIPLNFKPFFDEREGSLEKCSEIESVDQHIDLLIITYQGEHIFDKMYGTAIWELDFEHIRSVEVWKEDFSKYLSSAISQYEPRISITDFQLEISELVEEDTMFGNVNVRKRADIIIEATLKSNGRFCRFHYQLFLSPLSKN